MPQRRSGKGSESSDVTRRASNSTHNFFDQDIPSPTEGPVLQVQSSSSNVGRRNNNGEFIDDEENAPDEETMAILNAHGFYYMPIPELDHFLMAMNHQADGPPRPQPPRVTRPRIPAPPAPDDDSEDDSSDTSDGDENEANSDLDDPGEGAGNNAVIPDLNVADRPPATPPPSAPPASNTPNLGLGLGISPDFVSGYPVGSGLENGRHHQLRGQIIDREEGIDATGPSNRADPAASPQRETRGIPGTASGGSGTTESDKADVSGEVVLPTTRLDQMGLSEDKSYSKILEKYSAIIVSDIIEKASEQHRRESSVNKDVKGVDLSREKVPSLPENRVSNSPVSGEDDQYDYDSDFEDEEDINSSDLIKSRRGSGKANLGSKKDEQMQINQVVQQNKPAIMLPSISQNTIATRTKQINPLSVSSLTCKRYEQSLMPSPRRGGGAQVNSPRTNQSYNAAAKAYGVSTKHVKTSTHKPKVKEKETRLPPVKVQDRPNKKTNSSNLSNDRESEKVNQKSSTREKKGKQAGSLSNVKKSSCVKSNKPQQGRNGSPTKLPQIDQRKRSMERDTSLHRSADSSSWHQDQLIRALGTGARKLREMEKAAHSETVVLEYENSSSSIKSKKQGRGSFNGPLDGKSRRSSVGSTRQSQVEGSSSIFENPYRVAGRQKLKPTLPTMLKSEAYWQNGQIHIRINGSAKIIPEVEKLMEEQEAGIDGESVPLDVRITLMKSGKTTKAAHERHRRSNNGGVQKPYNGPLAYPELGVTRTPVRNVVEKSIVDTRTVHAQFNTKTARISAMPRRQPRSSFDSASSGSKI